MDSQPPLHFRRGQAVIAFADTSRGNPPRGVCLARDEHHVYGNVPKVWLADASFDINAAKLQKSIEENDKRLSAWISGHVVEDQDMNGEDDPIEVVFDPKDPSSAFKCADTGRAVESAEYVLFHRSHDVKFIEAYNPVFRP